MGPVFGAVRPRILRIEGASGCGSSELASGCSLVASGAIGAAEVFKCFAFFRRNIFFAILNGLGDHRSGMSGVLIRCYRWFSRW